MLKQFIDEIDGMIERDPAARSRIEVALTYPSFHAIVWYRMANGLWNKGLRFIPRVISQIGRFLTGIEIHPGATIGRRLFIDHGSGVVIGETAILGDNVTLYHDVTLGGVSPSEDSDAQRCTKRHPTLEDGVIVGSGAQILGPITVGKEARVGANAVVVKDVPESVTVVGIPAKVVMPRQNKAEAEFSPYGTPLGDLPDPVARAIEGLLAQVSNMQAEMRELENRVAEAEKQNNAMMYDPDCLEAMKANKRNEL